MGKHFHRPRRWSRFRPSPTSRRNVLLLVAALGAGWLSGHVGPHPGSDTPQMVPQAEAASRAQKFANDVIGQCNINPGGCTTQLTGEAAEVASTPIHDGVDGKDGADGNDGKDGKPGKDGKDGKDAPDVMEIFKFPNGTAWACPRTGATGTTSIHDCTSAKIEQPEGK